MGGRVVKSKRWHELQWLYQEALKREPAKRQAFLSEACAGDEKFVQEIASLLEQDERPQQKQFLEARTLKVEPPSIATEGSPSLVGRQLSHYRITEKIGQGGMGEVYLAQDDVLGRRIAIKILPAHVASDPKRMRRFVEEAKAASASPLCQASAASSLAKADCQRVGTCGRN